MGSSPVEAPLPAEVLETARQWNFDGYLAATLAPSTHQNDLIALAAFIGELERILHTVSEPTLAQIRIQWWRDELQRMTSEGSDGDHPLGTALAHSIKHNDWPVGLLLGVADAASDLAGDLRLDDDQALYSWIAKRFTASMELATLAHGGTPPSDVLAQAGRTYGLAVLSRMIATADEAGDGEDPRFAQTASDLAARALQMYSPVCAGLWALQRRERIGLLPVALVPLYARLEGAAPGRLRKICRLAGAHWLNRF